MTDAEMIFESEFDSTAGGGLVRRRLLQKEAGRFPPSSNSGLKS